MEIRPRKLFLLQRHSLHRLYFTSQPKSTTYQVPERQCLPSNFKLELPALLASSIHEPLDLSTVQRHVSSPPLIPMPRALNLRTISSPSLLQLYNPPPHPEYKLSLSSRADIHANKVSITVSHSQSQPVITQNISVLISLFSR